jgi:Flp pilus assembly protein TadG
MSRPRLLSDQRGSSAAEMVLMMPLLVLLLFGSVEIGYYFYTEHRVIDLARNYSRFAARRVALQETCPSATAVKAEILARLPLDMPFITDWSTSSDVTIVCDSGVTTGIYASTGRQGPVVTVKTQGTYPTMFAFLGFTDARWTVSATQNAALIGW